MAKTVNWWKVRVLFGGLRDGKRVKAGARIWVFDCIVIDKEKSQ
jgi:hypothetical protein